MEDQSPAIDFEYQLRRSGGRASRHSIVSVRLTRAEQGELERMAKAERKALSEWCRDALLSAARGQKLSPEFTEIVAMRALLIATFRNLACGKVMTPEAFAAELTTIRQNKHVSAAQLMQQYQEKGAEQ